MAEAWRYHNPVKITFGVGCLDEIGDLLAERSYALVTYKEPFFTALAARVAKWAGDPAITVDNVAVNPDFEALAECCARFAALEPAPETIVALGGGSVIDTAKVLAAAGGDFARLRHLIETGRGGERVRVIPIIAVPTTAGSGSELTPWATVWDTKGGQKYSLSHDGLFPERALVDPRLTLSLSREMTIASGLDALSHALESLWNVNANPVTIDFAVTAARELMMSLPLVVEKPDDLGLRTRVSRAALSAGLAFSNTRTALAHSLSYPITLRHGVPHGIACSFSLPMVMRAAIGASTACDTALRRIFGADLEAGSAQLEVFLTGLGVSVDPADHGVVEWDWQVMIDLAFDGERGRNFIGPRSKVTSTLALDQKAAVDETAAAGREDDVAPKVDAGRKGAKHKKKARRRARKKN